jgi:ribonuclease P protein component
VLEGKPRTDARIATARFGFTVTKQMGNAVLRNRIKRRLRAALAETFDKAADTTYDYVIIARVDSLTCPFPALLGDFVGGFARVHRGPLATSGRPRKQGKSP